MAEAENQYVGARTPRRIDVMGSETSTKASMPGARTKNKHECPSVPNAASSRVMMITVSSAVPTAAWPLRSLPTHPAKQPQLRPRTGLHGPKRVWADQPDYPAEFGGLPAPALTDALL